MAHTKGRPIASLVTRESVFRLPHPAGPVRPTLRAEEIPRAVIRVERAVRAAVGASRTPFRFSLSAQLCATGLFAARVVAHDVPDRDALQRIEAGLRALAAKAREPAIGEYEIYFLVAMSSTHFAAQKRERWEEVTRRLLGSCPSFRSSWEREVSKPDHQPESLLHLVWSFAEHAVDLIAAGRLDDLSASLAEIQRLASANESWALEVRRSLFDRVITRGEGRGVDVGSLGTICTPEMREVWSALWASRDLDLSHDGHW